MKQIFDWLRDYTGGMKQSREKMISLHDKDEIQYRIENLFIERSVLPLINEAEAKWEADCCEWKQEKILEFSLSDCVTSCGHAEHYSVGIDKYCRHCGKRIKISEVE